MNEDFIIPLNGLPAGETKVSKHAGKEFFEAFENPEILNADISVDILLRKSGRRIDVDCCLKGSITVPCDRCLEDLTLPVDTTAQLRVQPEDEDGDEEGREAIHADMTTSTLDLSQAIYDYACLSIPIQHVHPDGQCNPETVKYLHSEVSEEDHGDIEDNPFAKLKGLFDN